MIYEPFLEKMGLVGTVTGLARNGNFWLVGAVPNRLWFPLDLELENYPMGG
jgi:hypothetical protein